MARNQYKLLVVLNSEGGVFAVILPASYIDSPWQGKLKISKKSVFGEEISVAIQRAVTGTSSKMPTAHARSILEADGNSFKIVSAQPGNPCVGLFIPGGFVPKLQQEGLLPKTLEKANALVVSYSTITELLQNPSAEDPEQTLLERHGWKLTRAAACLGGSSQHIHAGVFLQNPDAAFAALGYLDGSQSVSIISRLKPGSATEVIIGTLTAVERKPQAQIEAHPVVVPPCPVPEIKRQKQPVVLDYAGTLPAEDFYHAVTALSDRAINIESTLWDDDGIITDEYNNRAQFLDNISPDATRISMNIPDAIIQAEIKRNTPVPSDLSRLRGAVTFVGKPHFNIPAAPSVETREKNSRIIVNADCNLTDIIERVKRDTIIIPEIARSGGIIVRSFSTPAGLFVSSDVFKALDLDVELRDSMKPSNFKNQENNTLYDESHAVVDLSCRAIPIEYDTNVKPIIFLSLGLVEKCFSKGAIECPAIRKKLSDLYKARESRMPTAAQ